MTIKSLFEELWQKAEAKKSSDLSPRVLEDLFCEALEISWSDFKLNLEKELSLQKMEKIQSWFGSWIQGYPLAYLSQKKEFFGLEFFVNSHVLIPRPETEILVERALQLKAKKIMDLGTGSGCIGLSLAKKLPQSQVLLIDKSQQALEVCEINRQRLSVQNAELLQCDLQNSGELPENWKQGVDLIVANPPYIADADSRVQKSVKMHEPSLALFSGVTGFECLETWLKWSYDQLLDGGHAIFEIGLGQESPLADFIASTDYSIIETIRDYAGNNRFLKLKK